MGDVLARFYSPFYSWIQWAFRGLINNTRELTSDLYVVSTGQVHRKQGTAIFFPLSEQKQASLTTILFITLQWLPVILRKTPDRPVASYLSDILLYFIHSCLIHSGCNLHSVPGMYCVLYPKAFSGANYPIWSVVLPDDLRLASAHPSGPREALLDILPIPSRLSYSRAWPVMARGQLCSHLFTCILPVAAYVLRRQSWVQVTPLLSKSRRCL